MRLAINKGIRGYLAGDSSITNLVSTRIYAVQAPLDAAMPYIIIAHNAGGSDNDTQLDSADSMWLVKAIAADGATAATIADAIRARLHNGNPTFDGGWMLLKCNEEALVSYVENVERFRYWHEGAIYRIRISQ